VARLVLDFKLYDSDGMFETVEQRLAKCHRMPVQRKESMRVILFINIIFNLLRAIGIVRHAYLVHLPPSP
jgi:hypothetical protein